MRDNYEIGSSPNEEECAQVGSPDFVERAENELDKYREMLEKRFPQAKEYRCKFVIEWYPHDFGSYGEVCISYNPEDNASNEFMLFVEGNLPAKWVDSEIMKTEIEVEGEVNEEDNLDSLDYEKVIELI